VNLASRGQAAFADPPALHFPPVEPRRCKFDGRCLDVARLLAPEDANGNRRCLSAAVLHQENWAADNLLAEESLVVGKNGRVGNGRSCASGAPPSWTTPAASTIINSQKIAECGGSAAACFNSSSNDKLPVHVNATRFTRGLTSLAISSDQYFSIGEVPTTTVTFWVSGNTRRIFSKAAR
jgi:hypothetical protein